MEQKNWVVRNEPPDFFTSYIYNSPGNGRF